MAKRRSTAALWLRNIYNSRRRHSARRLPPCAAMPAAAAGPSPRHPEFSRHQGIYCVALRKTAGRKVLANFPSGHAMSSRRLFLSGFLSSRARLRFAGPTILPTQYAPRYPQLASRNPGICKTVGTSTQLLAQWRPNQGRIFYLRIARSLSQRSGPPQLELRNFRCFDEHTVLCDRLQLS